MGDEQSAVIIRRDETGKPSNRMWAAIHLLDPGKNRGAARHTVAWVVGCGGWAWSLSACGVR